jgi:hypothetical protein
MFDSCSVITLSFGDVQRQKLEMSTNKETAKDAAGDRCSQVTVKGHI